MSWLSQQGETGAAESQLQCRAQGHAFRLPPSSCGSQHQCDVLCPALPTCPAAADVEAETEAQAAAAAAAADEDSKAHSVGLGLHIRGRTAMYEGLTDEDDPARFAYHNELSMAARGGEPGDAERVVDQMAAEGYVPGPRAYHALVLSHVRARDAEGALGAIRRCWDAGVTPLPETYAAVVAAHVAAGDLETAEAVFASNRRAGVDCAKSWQQLVAALLQAGQDEQAMALVKQVGSAPGVGGTHALRACTQDRLLCL